MAELIIAAFPPFSLTLSREFLVSILLSTQLQLHKQFLQTAKWFYFEEEKLYGVWAAAECGEKNWLR